MKCVLALLLLACTGLLDAQAIDRQRSRFLSEPNGRAGTCAPFRLRFSAPAGSLVEVEIRWRSVLLAKTVPVADAAAETVVPVPVAQGVSLTVRVDGAIDTFEPRLPSRLAGASYDQPYVAVFASDPMYARAIMPGGAGALLVDYFDTAEFFTDWRLLDGYDAVVLFNPDDARLPAGAQRAFAEFCSLGGAAFVAGSFRFGEQAVPVPSPGEPELAQFDGTAVHRFDYGAGTIYRCEWEALRKSRSAQQVIRLALCDHMWAGAAVAPGGPAASRTPPSSLPVLRPGPQAKGAPGPLFWVLAGALLFGAALAPVIASRISGRTWLPGAAIAVLAVGIGGAALTQGGPTPVADTWVVFATGPRVQGPCSARGFVLAEPAITEWKIELDAPGERPMPRPVPAVEGRNAWVVDRPLAGSIRAQAGRAELRSGRVADANFRDFAAAARLGSHGFNDENGRVLEWWLENNAWHGRSAAVAPARAGLLPLPPGADERGRGAIAVTALRAMRD